MFKIPLTLPVLFVLSWSALWDILLKISVTKRKVWQKLRWGACQCQNARLVGFQDKRLWLPCIQEQWCWKFETRPQGSAPRLRVVKLEAWNPSVKQRRNFSRKIPHKLYYDGFRTKLWCEEWRSGKRSDRKAIISGNFHLLICFVFLYVGESQETLYSLRKDYECLHFRLSGTRGLGSNISSETK